VNKGRRIAFDYGDVRIGVAITDQEAILATAGENLTALADDLDFQLQKLFEEYSPIYIVVGYPRHLSGMESAKSQSVNDFCKRIRGFSQLPIYLVDERLTTVSAARSLRESGINAKTGKAKIDGAAAVAILESALAHEKASGSPSQLEFK
jgi:putative Holliday junction resolvase